MKQTATILSHSRRPPCTIQRVLEDQGFDVQRVMAPVDDILHSNALDADLLYVTGGVIGAYQTDHYPFLNHEIDVIRRRIQAERPVLGICLGSQLMARALGANVYKGENGFEVAWQSVTIADHAQDHPIRHFCGKKTYIFHWHRDTFDLPDGATLLASTDLYENQAFEYGAHAVGVQFHPEVRAAALKEWYVLLVDQVTGDNPVISLTDLQAQGDQHAVAMETQTRLFMADWLEKVGL